MRIRSLSRSVAAFLVAFALLAPPVFAAEQPPSGPMVVREEGFEDALDPDFTVGPIVGYGPAAWWGPITSRRATGLQGLWCAGSMPATFPLYPVNTHGDASVALPQLAEYYSSSLAFSYTMPSLGQADADALNIAWRDPSFASWDYHDGYPLTSDNGWVRLTYDMARTDNRVNLSRRPGVVSFSFNDDAEGYGQTAFTGQGVTIDDLLVSGYKYGPVRNRTAARVGDTVHLTWAKPYGAVGSTTTDARSLTYRIWRSPLITPYVWTELTSSASRVNGTTYDDTTAAPGSAYRYFVQAWDTGSGSGYGAGNPSADNVAVAAVGGKIVEFQPIEGANRYDTAIAAVEKAFPDGADTVVIAWGRNFPDALGGAALCGAYDAPLLLTEKDYIPDSVRAEITNLGATHAIIIGSNSVVSDAVQTDLAGLRRR